MGNASIVTLGVDPGFAKLGYAIIKRDEKNKLNILTSGCLSTNFQDNYEVRLKRIYNQLNKIIKKFKPEILSIESLFFFKNQKTVINVAQIRGVIFLLAAQNNLKIIELTPLEIKSSITGYGRADKKQLQKMIELSCGINIKNKDDDIIDAIAIGLTFFYSKIRYLELIHPIKNKIPNRIRRVIHTTA